MLATFSHQLSARSHGAPSPGFPLRWLALVVLCLGLAGCGEESHYETPISTLAGNVTVGGAPVPAGFTVNFVSETSGLAMAFPLDDQGHYEANMAEGAGIPTGTYKVSVTPVPSPNPPTVEIPPQYLNVDTSGWVLELGSEGNSSYDLAIP